MLRPSGGEKCRLDLVKDAIPDGLKVHGDNPLKLLHGALSNAVHNLDDDECLERAQAVRVVLSELVSNIAHILKDEREVNSPCQKSRGRRGGLLRLLGAE